MRRLLRRAVVLALAAATVATVQPWLAITHAAITTNLVAFWELGESAGSTRQDSLSGCGGSGCDLVDHNTVGQAAGIVGNAADFTSPDYLDVADHADLDTGDFDWTIQAWAYLDDKSTFRWIVGKYGAVGNREYYLIYSSSADRFQFRCFTQANTAIDVNADSLGSPSTSTWYHILAGHDATANQCWIRINAGTRDNAAMGDTAKAGSTFQVEFGSSPTILGTVHDGRIDQAGYWTRLIDATDAATLYNSGSGLSYAAMSGGGGAAASDGLLLRKVGLFILPFRKAA